MKQYDLIEKAIIYLSDNYQLQPSLDEAAQYVGLSPFHFQRLFQEWAGVSPKKFVQYLSVKQAKGMLHAQQSLLDTSLDVGLSSSSRLHDLFISIEGMTPGEFKRGAESLVVRYEVIESLFGPAVIASTQKGICYLAFVSETEGVADLKRRFPSAAVLAGDSPLHQEALKIIGGNQEDLDQVKLHLKGSPFQIKVWEALLKVPSGSVCTYGDLAQSINAPQTSRAVGNAVGSNPVAYLIPCHRVIRSTGIIGGYRWGSDRKNAILAWEAAQKGN